MQDYSNAASALTYPCRQYSRHQDIGYYSGPRPGAAGRFPGPGSIL